jgi:dihydroorotate dehydrogenase
VNPVDQAFDALYQLTRPGLFQLDPEVVHDRTIRILSTISENPVLVKALETLSPEPRPQLQVRAFDRDLALPLAIAAGLDKNAVAFPALLALGFGSVETGTVTPLPQSGNPKPRVFRLAEDQGLINRMGFPNQGVEAAVNNLVRLRQPNKLVGCNIGPNKASVEAGGAPEDFAIAWGRVAPYCSYVAVNVSSPNTPGLRHHQRADALRAILEALREVRVSRQRRPLVLKISPDLTEAELDAVVEVALRFHVDAIAATNTTLDRPATLRSANAPEAGGLSGRPLASKAAATVRRLAALVEGKTAIIAAGGIFSGRDVLAAVSAGALFAQTYTGFIYRGPAMPALVQTEMLALMEQHEIPNLDELRGSNYQI